MSFWKRILGIKDHSHNEEPVIQTFDIRTEEQRARDTRMSADAVSKKSLGSEADSLVEELIKIGQVSIPDKPMESNYLPPSTPGIGNPRARDIGVQLYEMGNGKVTLMQEAMFRVYHDLGSIHARCLSACWDRIGTDGKKSYSPGEDCWID